MKPKKPNSARRKVCRVRIAWKESSKDFRKKEIKFTQMIVFIPGEGHNLEQFGRILVRGGNTQDLPGVQLKAVRGKYDLSPVIRKRKRSKFSCPRH